MRTASLQKHCFSAVRKGGDVLPKQHVEPWSEASPPGLTGDREFSLAAESLKLVTKALSLRVSLEDCEY